MNRDEIIIQNQNLIYFVLKRLNLYDRHEELFDLGMIGLIKGVDTYNPEKGTMATYLYRCIYTNVLSYFRKKQPLTISIDEYVYDQLTLEDTLSDDYDFTKELEIKEDLNRIYNSLNKLSDKEQDIMIKYFGLFNTKRYKQKELANLYNHSQSYIARIIRDSIKKIKEEIKRDEGLYIENK